MKTILIFCISLFCSFATLLVTTTERVGSAETAPPTLSKPFLDSNNGTFSVFYNSVDKKPPVTIIVTVRVSLKDGTIHKIERPLEAVGSGPTYFDTYQTTSIFLTAGSYTYQFSANDGTHDAIKASGETALGISEEAPFTLDHTVPTSNTSDGSGGCSLAQPNSFNFKTASLLFLISISLLLSLRKKLKKDTSCFVR